MLYNVYVARTKQNVKMCVVMFDLGFIGDIAGFYQKKR